MDLRSTNEKSFCMLDNAYIEKLPGLKDVIVTEVEDIGYDKHIHLRLMEKE